MGKQKEKSGVENAIAKASSQAALAAALGVRQQSVSLWLKRGYMPLERAVETEHLYGVPRATLADPRVVAKLDSGSGL